MEPVRLADVELTSNRVLILPDPDETVRGSLHLPGRAADQPMTGQVLAVGPGWQFADGTILPMTVKPGDRVLFSRAGHTEVRIHDDTGTTVTARILRETDVHLVLE